MKLIKIKENETLKMVLLPLTIILGFVFILSFSVIYVSDAIRNNNACGCVIPIPYMILILSSLGLFIGSLSSYILVSKNLRYKKEKNKNIKSSLRFLEEEERKIVEELIKSEGELMQANFEQKTGMHRVKVHRVINKLINKKIIEKQSNGKVKRIVLSKDIKDAFC